LLLFEGSGNKRFLFARADCSGRRIFNQLFVISLDDGGAYRIQNLVIDPNESISPARVDLGKDGRSEFLIRSPIPQQQQLWPVYYDAVWQINERGELVEISKRFPQRFLDEAIPRLTSSLKAAALELIPSVDIDGAPVPSEGRQYMEEQKSRRINMLTQEIVFVAGLWLDSVPGSKAEALGWASSAVAARRVVAAVAAGRLKDSNSRRILSGLAADADAAVRTIASERLGTPVSQSPGTTPHPGGK
jgi:hypothetical protein